MRGPAYLVLLFLVALTPVDLGGQEIPRPQGFERAVKALQLIRPAGTPQPRDFVVSLVTGERFRLGDHRGSVAVINFWATWCEPCREEMPALERLWRQQREQSVVVLAISTDVDPTVVAQFVSRQRYTFPIGLDARGELARQFGTRALPTTAIIDRDGYLSAFAFGPRRWDSRPMVELLEALRATPAR